MAPLFLLRLEPVQKELKVTDEQKEKIHTLAEEMRPAPRGENRPSREEMRKEMKERAEKIEKKLAEILQPEQAKRLKQIHLQVQGPRAFESLEVVKTLKITDEQKTKVKDILSETRKQMQALGRPDPEATPADRKERIEKLQKIQKEATAKCLEALTPEQKKSFEELRGKPFEIDLSALGGRLRSRREPPPRERSDW
jgi:Spy/CpxP family protein refolding chaperone